MYEEQPEYTPPVGLERGPRLVIAVLAALLLVGILPNLIGGVFRVVEDAFGPTPEHRRTMRRLLALGSAVEQLRTADNLGRYPPTETRRLVDGAGATIGESVGMPNGANVGIETIVLAVHMDGVRVVIDDISDADYSNTDDDDVPVQVGRLNTTSRLEIVDAWGNPFCYVQHRDYERLTTEPAAYVLGGGPKAGETVLVRPRKDSDGFYRPKTFQLFSFGPDGEPGTDDDLHFGE